MNNCPHCGIGFNSFVDYHEHIAMNHWHQAKEEALAAVQTHRSNRSDLGKQEYKGPMDKDVKARIVAKGETRLGKEFFHGML